MHQKIDANFYHPLQPQAQTVVVDKVGRLLKAQRDLRSRVCDHRMLIPEIHSNRLPRPCRRSDGATLSAILHTLLITIDTSNVLDLWNR